MINLFDTLSQANMEQPDTFAEVPYLGDVQYHQNAYMIEAALRDMGVLPSPSPSTDDTRPYDGDLRRLIESVTLE